jgi:high-affinity iron transporter
MGESLLISLREGFEAALVVSIVLAFVRRGPRPELGRWVWVGAVSALVVATIAGVVLHLTIDGLEGTARARTFGAICLAAAALLTWMIFWMRCNARHLKGHLEGRAAGALETGSVLGIALVAFAAVLREGLETALFLVSTTTTSAGTSVVAGTLAGLAMATLLGVAVYHGSRRFNMRRFFQVTGVLIVLFAAGLMAKTAFFLQASGDLGSVNNAVYDVTRIHWLTAQSQVGRFLAGIFGWDPRPSFEQAIAYVGYLVPVLVLFFREPSTRVPAATAAGGPGASGRSSQDRPLASTTSSR